MLFCHVLTPLKRVSDSLSCLFLCIIRGPARGFHLSLSSQSQTLNFNTEQQSFLFQFLPFPLLKKKKKKNQNPNFLYFPKPQFILYLFAQISSSVQTLKPRETLLILFFFFSLVELLLFSFTNIVLRNKQNPVNHLRIFGFYGS